MKSSLTAGALAEYVACQIDYLFPDRGEVRSSRWAGAVKIALDRVDRSFGESAVPHYCRDGEAVFNHLFSDQYAAFLWFLANTLHREGEHVAILDKVFYLNKTLHGLECMHDTQLPEVFFFSHTTGVVLGKAQYGEFFVVSQGCTVGHHRGVYPTIGRGVALGANASVIGNCRLGDRVSIGSNSGVFCLDVASDHTVFPGSDGGLVVRPARECYAQKFFLADLSTL